MKRARLSSCHGPGGGPGKDRLSTTTGSPSGTMYVSVTTGSPPAGPVTLTRRRKPPGTSQSRNSPRRSVVVVAVAKAPSRAMVHVRSSVLGELGGAAMPPPE